MIQIIQENEFFIVLNKPSGTSVHNEKPSVADQLAVFKKPLHFVNRLDQETSGLMVVAQKPEYHGLLALSLDEGRKTYRALLRGAWKSPAKQAAWTWPLTDRAEGRQNPKGISADRVPCESRVQLVQSNKYFSEVLVEILTGRQHQIRKHAAIAKQPIVGDPRYNEKEYNKMIAQRYGIDRLWLQCEKLEFTFNSKPYSFERKLDLKNFFSGV